MDWFALILNLLNKGSPPGCFGFNPFGGAPVGNVGGLSRHHTSIL